MKHFSRLFALTLFRALMEECMNDEMRHWFMEVVPAERRPLRGVDRSRRRKDWRSWSLCGESAHDLGNDYSSSELVFVRP
jgi:hypothetical protein